MSEENVAIRLKGFMDEVGLTSSQFADQCGIPRPTLSQLLTGRNKKISDVLIGQIHSAFPQLSVMWLLFGEGTMLTPKHEEKPQVSFGPDLFSEPEIFPAEGSEKSVCSNLSGLNAHACTPLNTVAKSFTVDHKALELEREIEKMRKNPRKVVQITIYYDDSTFETFYPGK